MSKTGLMHVGRACCLRVFAAFLIICTAPPPLAIDVGGLVNGMMQQAIQAEQRRQVLQQQQEQIEEQRRVADKERRAYALEQQRRIAEESAQQRIDQERVALLRQAEENRSLE